MNRTLVIVLLTFPLCMACDDPRQQKIDTLKEETIRIHDEVMPRMDELIELSSGLKIRLESLQDDTTDSAKQLRLKYTAQGEAIDSAYEGMMGWMAAYRPDYEIKHAPDSAVVYYEQQRVKISDVKKSIEQTIDDASKLVEK